MPIAVMAGDVNVGELDTSWVRGAGVRSSSEPKIQHLHDAIGADFDVGGFQIAMDDASFVRRFERQGDLMRDGQCLVGGNRALGDALGECGSFDQFQHEGRLTILLLEAVDGGDVRVVQRRQDLGFPLKPREACGVGRHRRRQDLDRHVAFQLAVTRAIDLAHSAFADLRGDFVRSDAGAGGEYHVERGDCIGFQRCS